MIDEEGVRGLIHGPESPTYGDELIRRINSFNRIRVREMDYLIAKIRRAGLDGRAYRTFDREIGRL